MKVSNLTVAGALSTGDIFYLVQGTNSRKLALSTLSSYILTSSFTASLGATTVTTLTASGVVAINNGSVTTTVGTMNLFLTNATAVNFAHAATALTMGATTGTTTVRNNLTVSGGVVNATTFNGNATTATEASQAVILKTARTIALSGAATGTATSFNGSANITIPVTALNASSLTAGTVPDARISGKYTGITDLGLGRDPDRGPIVTFGTITGGSGYTDGTYLNVALTGGTGTLARADIVVSGGAVSSVTLVDEGSYYTVNDSLSATAATIGGTGTGFSVLVASVRNVGIYLFQAQPRIRLENSTTGTVAGTELGSILFSSNDATTGGRGDKVRIVAEAEGTSGGGRLKIFTSINAGEPTEALVIAGNNNLTGVGTADFTRFLGNTADTAALPSFSFTGDPNTGIWNPAADQLGFSTAGTNRLTLTSTGLTGTGTADFTRFLGNAADSVTAPSFSFTTDTNTGIWSPGADQLGITTGGVNRLTINSTAVTSVGAVVVGTDLTVSGGDIVLGGTGRIQGVDTVTDPTDAASKSYVDSAVTAVGSGVENTGGAAPYYGARAWVNFDGNNGTIYAAGNVSSVTRSQEGNYTVNLATALSTVDYAASTTIRSASIGIGAHHMILGTPTTTSFGIQTTNGGNSRQDFIGTSVVVFE